MRTGSYWVFPSPVLLGVCLLSLGASAEGLWFDVGPVFRGNMRASISGTSYVQQRGVHDPSATGGPLASPASVGALNEYADRTYDDPTHNYVKKDPGTGTAGSLDPNTTWNWGFNNPAQYNAGAQTLSYQKQGDPGYSLLRSDGIGQEDEFLGAGVQLHLGIQLREPDEWSLDWSIGFEGVWGDTEHFAGSTYSEEVRHLTVTDTYDVSAIGAANFPATGFQGTYAGPFDTPPVIPSPVIPNLPTSRSTATSAVLSSSHNELGFDIDQGLYQLSMGPEFGWMITPELRVKLRPAVSAVLIDAEVHRTESFVQTTAGGGRVVVSQWSDRVSDQQVFLGLGATVGADWDLGKGFFVGVFGGYEWVTERMDLEVGPNRVTLAASGWLAGAVAGLRF